MPGYLLKRTGRATLIRTIRTVYERREFLAPSMKQQIEKAIQMGLPG